ncbi:hypothetical protein [Flavobacterium sp. N2038]|uniref:hypothetical protein n=1 Tax=Flavobacterium sp. N2038 TaxID=2986829 RepID=UPI00222599DB|nr:hypothetical protein [Flavobacterium sp. N2038]
MANKDSKVKYEQFIERLDFFILFVFSGLLILTIVMACLIGNEILKSTNIDGSIHIDSSLCTVFFISCFFFFLALYRITIVFKEAIFFINEVQINHNAIILTGYYCNTKWQETLDIKNTQVDIVTQKRGRAPEIHYLQFIDELNLKYNINTSFYWSYAEILILYRDIKNLQKEKIGTVKRTPKN